MFLMLWDVIVKNVNCKKDVNCKKRGMKIMANKQVTFMMSQYLTAFCYDVTMFKLG